MATVQTTLKIATDYYERGFCVIPVHYRDKKSEINWRQYQNQRPNREQIQHWFGDGKNHNIGVICGNVSGGLVVLVFNKEEDFSPFFNGVDILKQTPVAYSKRGAHVYLRTNDQVES